jgi:hypothetical protein
VVENRQTQPAKEPETPTSSAWLEATERFAMNNF